MGPFASRSLSVNLPVPVPPDSEPARDGGAGALNDERLDPALDEGAMDGGRDAGALETAVVAMEGGECV